MVNLTYTRASAPKLTYEQEKALGLRSPSGVKYLKKLTPKHRQCILLHMQGMKQLEIAEAMGMKQPWVSNILNDPLAQEEIRREQQSWDQEFRAMGGMTMDALRSALRDPDPSIRLSAADKWLKAHGYYDKGKGTGPLSAEDIVAEMLKQTGEGGTTSVTIEVSRKSGEEPAPVIEHLEDFS